MRALVTGAGGQLGVELLRTAPAGIQATGLKHSECDISDQSAVDAAMAKIRPDIVINAAAYNRVDDAERESKTAYSINAIGPGSLARAVERSGGRIIHVSTDYVFDGESNKPYRPTDAPHPLNIYGKSKLAGEEEVARAAADHLVIRTSWLFSAHGRNFLQIVFASLQAGRPVRAINDQTSVPTSCRGLAEVIWLCAEPDGPRGVEHWVDAETATRFDFATAIQQKAVERGLVRPGAPIEGVPAAQFSSAATRPRYSVLDASQLSNRLGKKQRSWRDSLDEIFDEIALKQAVAPGRRN